MRETAKGIAKTKEAWQVYYSQELSDDDALEIMVNLTGFFTLLHVWEQEKSNSMENSKEEQGTFTK